MGSEPLDITVKTHDPFTIGETLTTKPHLETEFQEPLLQAMLRGTGPHSQTNPAGHLAGAEII